MLFAVAGFVINVTDEIAINGETFEG